MDAHKGGGEGRAGFYYLGWGGVGGASARRVARSAWWCRISSIKPLARPSTIRAGHSPSWDVIKGLPGGLPAPANPGTPGLRLRGNVGCPPHTPLFSPTSLLAVARCLGTPRPGGVWLGGGDLLPPGPEAGEGCLSYPPVNKLKKHSRFCHTSGNIGDRVGSIVLGAPGELLAGFGGPRTVL